MVIMPPFHINRRGRSPLSSAKCTLDRLIGHGFWDFGSFAGEDHVGTQKGHVAFCEVDWSMSDGMHECVHEGCV